MLMAPMWFGILMGYAMMKQCLVMWTMRNVMARMSLYSKMTKSIPKKGNKAFQIKGSFCLFVWFKESSQVC